MKYNFDTPFNRKNTNCLKWDEAPDDVLPMWVADMDFPTAPCVLEALRKRIEHGAFGYNLVPDSFYDSIIWWLSHRHGWTPQREWIQYTSGVVPAVSAIIKGLCPAGSAVMTFVPAYNCFFSSIRNNDCRLVECPLRWSPSEEYATIDFDAFESLLFEQDVRLFLLCNPHNPTGRVWTYDELHLIAEICARLGVIVLSDEIHCEFVDPELGRPYLPFAPIAQEAGCQLVVANAPNKAFNIAGLQNAYIITPSEEFHKRIDKAININEVCDINCFSFIALQAAYTPEGEEWLDQLNSYLFNNFHFFRNALKEALPNLPISRIEGTYLAWIDIRSLYDCCCENGIHCNGGKTISDALCSYLLHHRRLWINEGDMYGQSGFLRVNLATQRYNIQEALHRLLPFPDIRELDL